MAVKSARSFHLGSIYDLLALLKCVFHQPLASVSFGSYCFDMKEAADREKTEQALGKVLRLTLLFATASP